MRPLVWETGHVAAGARRDGGVWRYWRQCRLFPDGLALSRLPLAYLGKCVRDLGDLMSREGVGVWETLLLLRLPA